MAKRAMDNPIQIDAERLPRLASQLCDDIVQAEADRSSYIRLMKEHRALLKSHQTASSKPWTDASDLHVPFLKYARNALLARLRRALLSPTPILYCEGVGPAKPYEGAFESFLHRQLTRQVQLGGNAGRRLLQAAVDDGTAIAYVRWETIKRRERRYEVLSEPEIDAFGEVSAKAGQMKAVNPWVTRYDGPVVDYVPIENCGTYPAAFADMTKSTGVYLRVPMFGEEILQHLTAGRYDPAGVQALVKKLGDDNLLKNPSDELRSIEVTGASVRFDPAFISSPLTITECYWRLPSADTADDEDEPGTDWLVTLYEPSQTVLAARPAHEVWGFSDRPLVPVRVLPDNFGLLGDSLADLAGDGQQAMTQLLRQALNAGDRRINPEIFELANAMSQDEWDDFNDNRSPGMIHKIRNVQQVSDAILPFAFDGDPYAMLPLFSAVQEQMRNATGVSNLMTGNAQGRRTTAHEIQRMSEEGQEMVMDMVDTAGEAVEDIGSLVKQLDYVYAGRKSLQELWMEANPQSTPEDMFAALSGEYDLSAAGTTLTTSKAVRKQQAMEKYQIFNDDPFVTSNVQRMWGLKRMVLVDGFGERQPESIIGTEQEAIQAQQELEAQRKQQAMPPAQGMAPGAAAPAMPGQMPAMGGL